MWLCVKDAKVSFCYTECMSEFPDPNQPQGERFRPNVHSLKAIVAKDELQAAYEQGRAQADQAIALLKRGGVLSGELQGQFEHEDIEFKKQLQDIVAANNMQPQVVYNPGSGRHASLATAFPEAHTIFTDTDADAMHDMTGQGFEAYEADMHDFVLPDGLKADLVLILNAGYMTEEELDRVTNPDGLVVVNDWHDASSFMQRECPGYDLVGAEDELGYVTDLSTIQSERFANNTNALYVFKRNDSTKPDSIRDRIKEAAD